MATHNLTLDSFWVDKSKYDEAEKEYYERLGNVTLTPLADEVAKARQRLIEIRGSVEDGATEVDQMQQLLMPANIATEPLKPAAEPQKKTELDTAGKDIELAAPECLKTPELECKGNQNEKQDPVQHSEQVEESKQRKNKSNKQSKELNEIISVSEKSEPVQTKKENLKQASPARSASTPKAETTKTDVDAVTCSFASFDASAAKFQEFQNVLSQIQNQLNLFDSRLTSVESLLSVSKPAAACKLPKKVETKPESEDDDDVDLFGSESEDDDAAEKIKQERVAAYNAKKSKKPTLIAKSSIVLDVKPWDDETDMKALEASVRKIVMDGLLWGASKLVPLAYGIHKLQINCVVEDEKVSIDALQEEIESIEDYVQSVDIAAFNKI